MCLLNLKALTYCMYVYHQRKYILCFAVFGYVKGKQIYQFLRCYTIILSCLLAGVVEDSECKKNMFES